MKSLTKPQKITFILTLIYTAWIRLQGLGYSEYQGDEILTLDFVDHFKQGKFFEYLFTRNKGPLQYIVNLLTYKLTGGFDEFWIRLPYALAGILFVWVIFEVTRRVAKNNWAGIIAAGLAASNGLFIAFSRITQYQSFVQLLLALTVLIFVKNSKEGGRFLKASKSAEEKSQVFQSQTLFLTLGNRQALFLRPSLLSGLAGLTFGLAGLFHYDALTFLAFACFYFGKRILESKRVQPAWGGLNPAVAFFIPFLFLAGTFYIPFFLNPSADSTPGYLAERVFGSGFMPRTLYTEMLMKFYIPKELLYTLVTLSCLSLYFILEPSARYKQQDLLQKFCTFCHSEGSRLVGRPKNPLTKGFPKRDSSPPPTAGQNDGKNTKSAKLLLLPVTLIFTFYFSTLWIKPRGATLMFYTLTAVTLAALFFKRGINRTLASLFAWFLASSCFYLFFNKTPRTHVYIIFIPMFILSGYTMVKLFELLNRRPTPPTPLHPPTFKVCKVLKVFPAAALAIGYLLTLTIVYSHKIFVDKDPEYAWGDKTVFGREMIHINKNPHHKIQGIFGFPQRREWKKIGQLFKKGCLTGTYQTNEKDRIPAFYLRQSPVTENADNIILVESPVSWNYRDINKIPEGYNLLKTYFIGDHSVTTVYGRSDIYPDARTLCE